jgi:hypothetical protein
MQAGTQSCSQSKDTEGLELVPCGGFKRQGRSTMYA